MFKQGENPLKFHIPPGRSFPCDHTKKKKQLSDSPTATKESLKLLIEIVANNDFELGSVNIGIVFLSAKIQDREVLIKPPKDQWVK